MNNPGDFETQLQKIKCENGTSSALNINILELVREIAILHLVFCC